MKTFPTLYKRTATGAVQEWTIEVEAMLMAHVERPGAGMVGVIITVYGQVEGKLQETRDCVYEGKNSGKKNTTTAVEQAEAEALSKWTKKQEREGYVQDLARAQAGETDQEGGIAPMLAKPLDEVEEHLRFPIDAQAKHDGQRVIAVIEDGVCTLWSRKRKRLISLPHIVRAWEELLRGRAGRFVFDGEGYRHGWPLQKIASYVSQKKTPRPDHEQIVHRVYDVPSLEAPWRVRLGVLEGILGDDEGRAEDHGPLQLVETVTVNDLPSAWALHDTWVAQGYEGAILRNRHAMYEAGKRSKHLVKLKVFEDHEWPIVAVGPGRGKFSELAVFTCQLENGETFECCAPGNFEDRAEWLALGDSLIGKHLTVKHKGYSQDQVPMYPVGKAVRDYE